MTPQKFAGLALLALTAATVPAAAYDGDGESTVRAERNWQGTNTVRRGSSGTAVTVPRDGAAGGGQGNWQRGRTNTSPVQAERRDRDDDHNVVREGRRGPNDGNRVDRYEAERIARAHRQSDGHVVLRRDGDGYGNRGYRRYGHYEAPYYDAPRRHRRWWRFWR